MFCIYFSFDFWFCVGPCCGGLFADDSGLHFWVKLTLATVAHCYAVWEQTRGQTLESSLNVTSFEFSQKKCRVGFIEKRLHAVLGNWESQFYNPFTCLQHNAINMYVNCFTFLHLLPLRSNLVFSFFCQIKNGFWRKNMFLIVRSQTCLFGIGTETQLS